MRDAPSVIRAGSALTIGPEPTANPLMDASGPASFDPALIDPAIARAERCGALQAIHTESERIEDGGLSFLIRWVSTLASKDQARVSAAGRRGPDYNPFLPPEPELTLGALGARHLVVLNKYPVIERHLLLVTRRFEDQSAPLTAADFDALRALMAQLGGLGFYNGGEEAGASQRHKHLQWIPAQPGNACLTPFVARLPAIPAFETVCDPALQWAHRFVRLPPSGFGECSGEPLMRAFEAACSALDLRPDTDPMPPYNLLIEHDWLLLVPRSRERHADISVNALGFAGSLFVRRAEQIDAIRRFGPLRLLAGVACPRRP